MTDSIQIKDNRGEHIGALSFNDNPDRLSAYRVAGGVKLLLPATFTLKTIAPGQAIPLLTDFFATITMNHATSIPVEVGSIRSETWCSSSESGQPNTSFSHETTFEWRLTFTQLAAIEKLREAKLPVFKFDLRGQLSFLLSAGSQYPYHQVRSEPQQIVGDTVVTYPTEIWVDRLRRIGVMENVLVEIPLPPRTSPEWKGVWDALIEARDNFEKGGSTGWKGCVVAVRLALELWRKIETEKHGAGWKAPTVQERESRTWEERTDNLRWHLLQCAHKAAHSSAEEWTRDDAVMMLSTLSALIAKRNP